MRDYKDRMKDYVPVNERIAAFIEANPDGSLQSEIVELTTSRVTVKAYAYRQPGDPRPGTGHSSLEIPGSTPYTRGSEIENAETSAWGRAIAALGFEVKRGVASQEEIANKSGQSVPVAQQASRTLPTAPAPNYRREELAALVKAKGITAKGLEDYAGLIGIPEGERATEEQMDRLIAAIEGHGTDAPLDLFPKDDGIPPKPGSDEYKALPAFARSSARAYWHGQEVTA